MVLGAASHEVLPLADIALDAYASGFNQKVRLEADVLMHVLQHKQLSANAKEAGGQLFGTVDQSMVRIIRATGPYRADERSRFRYRSNPSSAQKAIQEQSEFGLFYLGEWHTHAEDHPSASYMDGDAMSKLMSKSKLNSSSLVMLIVGRAAGPSGLSLCTVNSQGERLIWSFSSKDPCFGAYCLE